MLQPIPLSFDASIKCMLVPLMTGGKLVLPEAGPFDAAKMLATIEQQQVQLINCVPSMFYPVLERAEKNRYQGLRSLKMLALGGESADLSRFKPWLLSEHSQCQLANIYGPTECTDISVAYHLANADLDQFAVMPIGHPIDNARVYVVDEQLNPVLPGVTGELLIAGRGVGIGYWGQAGAKSSAYIADHFAGHGHLYRSGDMVKWDKNGVLHYLGRVDDQIKVNGIRIEVGEIEMALLALKGIEQAVVLKLDERLVAFVLTRELTPPKTAQIREHLRHTLPSTWIPKAFVTLRDMPLLPNGKIDHHLLKAIPIAQDVEQREILAPSTEIERILVEVWCEVLGLDKVGINENFFELGGDSMLAVRVVAVAEQAGISLSVADIFESQSVEALAKVAVLDQTITTAKDHGGEADDAFDMLSDEDLSMMFDEE